MVKNTVHTAQAISAIANFIDSDDITPHLDRLRRALPKDAKIYIAGGALRNVIMTLVHGQAPPTRDVDLFIGAIAKDFPLAERLSAAALEHTELGGLRWRPQSSAYVFDICLLPHFHIIAKFRLAPTLQNFMTAIDFTVNAIVFDIDTRNLFERGCRHAILQRMIDFNTTYMISKTMLAYRIVLIRHKTGFRLARPTFIFLKHQIDFEGLNALRTLFGAKQGKTMAATLMADYDRICAFNYYSDYIAQHH